MRDSKMIGLIYSLEGPEIFTGTIHSIVLKGKTSYQLGGELSNKWRKSDIIEGSLIPNCSLKFIAKSRTLEDYKKKDQSPTKVFPIFVYSLNFNGDFFQGEWYQRSKKRFKWKVECELYDLNETPSIDWEKRKNQPLEEEIKIIEPPKEIITSPKLERVKDGWQIDIEKILNGAEYGYKQ